MSGASRQLGRYPDGRGVRHLGTEGFRPSGIQTAPAYRLIPVGGAKLSATKSCRDARESWFIRHAGIDVKWLRRARNVWRHLAFGCW